MVVEQALGTARAAPGLSDTFAIPTSIAPVTLRVRAGGATSPEQPFRFTLPGRQGGFVLEADVAPAELAAARAQWRAITRAAMLGVVAITLLLCTAPLMDQRRRTRDRRRFAAFTAILIGLIIAARGVLFVALSPLADERTPTPFDLLLTTLSMAAVVWLVLDMIERRRFARPRVRMLSPVPLVRLAYCAVFVLTGAASAGVMWGYERVLQRVVADTNLDLLHFSLHPLSGGRLALEFALVLLHASVLWGAAALVRLPATFLRAPRGRSWRLSALGGWLAGVLATSALAWSSAAAVPIGPMWLAILASGACALALARVNGRMRRVSQTARLAVFFLGAGRAGDCHVSVVACGRHASQRASDRHDVRTTGGQPARGSSEAIAAGGRGNRRVHVARGSRPRRRIGAAPAIRRARLPSGRAPTWRSTA